MFVVLALIIAGAFGAYSLGANNISNVMGVFLYVAPFPEIQFDSGFSNTHTSPGITITGFSKVNFIGDTDANFAAFI